MRNIVIMLFLASCVLHAGENTLTLTAFNGVQATLDGRIMLDAAAFNGEDSDLAGGIVLREARLALKLKLGEQWRAEMDVDFSRQQARVMDMWIAREVSPMLRVTAGHFKPPFSLEELTSSRNLVFAERAYPNAFTPGRRLGLAATAHQRRWWMSAGVFGPTVASWDDRKDGIHDDPGCSLFARAVGVPFIRADYLLTAGGSIGLAQPEYASTEVAFDSRPETEVNLAKFLDTGDIPGVDDWTLIGAEGALQWRNVLLSGEYISCEVARADGYTDLTFDGGYAALSWVLTGERREWVTNDAEFGGIAPTHGWGALELALRYSYLNLTDDDYQLAPDATDDTDRIKGGKANNYTLACNWYPRTGMRLLTEIVMVDNSVFANGKGALGADDDFWFVQTRLQVCF